MGSLSQFAFLSFLALIAVVLQGCGGSQHTKDQPGSGDEKTPKKQKVCKNVADVLPFIRINNMQDWSIQDFKDAGAFLTRSDPAVGVKGDDPLISWDWVDGPEASLAPVADKWEAEAGLAEEEWAIRRRPHLQIPIEKGFGKMLLEPCMCDGTCKKEFSGVEGFPCRSVRDALSFLNINGKQRRTNEEFEMVGAYVTTSTNWMQASDADKIPWNQVGEATFRPGNAKAGPARQFHFVLPGANPPVISAKLTPKMCEKGNQYAPKFTHIGLRNHAIMHSHVAFKSLAQLRKERVDAVGAVAQERQPFLRAGRHQISTKIIGGLGASLEQP